MRNGLQDHGLWNMDGRQWIEVLFETRNEFEAKMRQRAIDNGQLKIIPQDRLSKFVQELKP